MAKDPAVLFYTSDFLTGTITMSNEEVGMYIRLLCLQHQKGFLFEKDMLKICYSYVEDIWSKFENIDGKFYNIRMKEETERRIKYSQSRSNNRKIKKDVSNISESYENHMETETETNGIGVIGEKPESRFTSFRTTVYFDVETLKSSEQWAKVGELVYRKTFKSPEKDGGLVRFCLNRYDLWLGEKGEWLKGVTPERFAAGLAKWVLNEKNFNK
jgi:uncharacterized protein YdaU (DUF1376 family)